MGKMDMSNYGKIMTDHEETECQMCDAPFDSEPSKRGEQLICNICLMLENTHESTNDVVRRKDLVEAVRLILDTIRE